MNLVTVDVSKEKLDVLYDNSGIHRVIGNNEAEITNLIKELKTLESPRLVFEASGGYDRLLRVQALNNEINCSICNGLRVREFARSQGKLAKTDKIDVHVIAEYAKKTALMIINSRDLVIEDLKALNTRRDQLLSLINQESNKLEFNYPQIVLESIENSLKTLREELERIEEAMQNMIEANESLRKKNELLRTIPGIGPVVSVTFLTSLPELGSLSRSKIASLAGLAPFNRDSGKFSGRRKTGHSRGQLKSKLYMATLSAIKHNSKTKKFYNHLLAKGKKKKVAIVACMRKLVVMANAMLKNQEVFKV